MTTDERTPTDRPTDPAKSRAPQDPMQPFKDSADVVAFLRQLDTRIKVLESSIADARAHQEAVSAVVAEHGQDIDGVHELLDQLHGALKNPPSDGRPPAPRGGQRLPPPAPAAADGAELAIDVGALGPGTHMLPGSAATGGLPVEVRIKPAPAGAGGIGGLGGRRRPGSFRIVERRPEKKGD